MHIDYCRLINIGTYHLEGMVSFTLSGDLIDISSKNNSPVRACEKETWAA